MAKVYIGLGSNLNEPVTQLRQAIQAMDNLADVSVDSCSSFYITAPVGFEDQPDFINAACSLDTLLSASELLKKLQQIEQQQGRVRSDNRNAARTLDLDILLYEGQSINTRELVIPHPRLHLRAFVLYPLYELDPGLVIPGHGSVSELLKQCSNQRIEKLDKEIGQ